MSLHYQKIGLLLFSIILLACNGSGINNESQDEQKVVDSISSWLEAGKDKALTSAARRNNLNKAIKAIKKDTPDSLKIDYYSKLSIGFQRLGDSLLFRKYNGDLQSLAQELGNLEQLANAHWDLGIYFSNLAIRDSSYYHFYKAYTFMSEAGEIGDAGVLLLNAAIQQSKARAYVESEQTTFKAIELLEQASDYRQLFQSYNNLGSVNKELDAFERSLEYFSKAQEYLDKLEESVRVNLQRNLNNNLGNLYKDQEMWEKAIPYFESALGHEDLETNRPRAYAQTLNNLTISRFLNGDTTAILDDLFKALKIFTLEDDNLGISTVSYSLAVYYEGIGNKAEAIFYAQDAIEKAELSTNYKRKLETLKLMAKIDPQNDLVFNEYVTLSERLQREERAIRDKFARIERETDEALAAAESMAKERQLIIGIGLGLILLGIAGLIIITQRIRVQRLRFEQQQQEANQEIFNLMLGQKQKMEEGKQSEQKRISEELHDGVLGALNGIRMVLLGLNGKSDEGAITMRQDAIEKLKGVQEEIRAISHELNDAAYQKFDNFITSIKDLINETEGSSGLQLDLKYNEDVEWDALRGEIKINLYRIVQECIQNVVKHAQANKVELDFQSWDDMLKISIKDDGRGFDTRKMKKGIGHRNIKSRLEKINGTWNIESAIGKGSHITVILPYVTETSQTNILDSEAVGLQETKKD